MFDYGIKEFLICMSEGFQCPSAFGNKPSAITKMAKSKNQSKSLCSGNYSVVLKVFRPTLERHTGTPRSRRHSAR
jgi:hypothetical protein